MTKPVLILDPNWRTLDELFSPGARTALFNAYEVIWGQNDPIPQDVLAAALPQAEVLIAATPRLDSAALARAPKLRTVIEVSGAFPETIDYRSCFASGVEILSCAPGFRQSVAEMGLAMALSTARGLIHEHEAFRNGRERWLADNPKTDFTLFRADVGFIGFGQIAQELCRLLAPFRPAIKAFDPWLPLPDADDFGITLVSLEEALSTSRCVFVTASPTSENYHLLNAERLALLRDHALLVVLSRAHLVDYQALTHELQTKRIRACIDVFPEEPLPVDDPLRTLMSTVLSPHRAAAIDKGRHLIGDMIVSDLEAIRTGGTYRQLSRARADTIDALAGVGDAKAVADMASAR